MSVTENAVDFNKIERMVQKKCQEIGCGLLKTILENWDAELSAGRDRGAYRHKGKRKTVIKTVLGEVEYERTVYEAYGEDGIKKHIYLLDEAMGKNGSGNMSVLLSEQVVQASCEGSYRSAARSVSEMTGQSISHTAAWNVLQAIGDRLDAKEQQAAKQASANKGTGDLEAKLLFEEQDGIWLNMQGKSRKTYGKNREMKLAIAYDGAKKTGKNRYELANKVACANFEDAGKFRKRKEGAIAGVYNTDEIETRILGGDGANWIRQSQTDETVHFQLDQFHRNRAVLQYVSDPDARKTIMGLLYSNQQDLLLAVIEAYANSTEDEQEREGYLTLFSYFQINKDGLIPWHRRGLSLPKPPAGKTYRRLGAMESNVFTIIGNRMKDRRACWSINGGNNLARLLCLKFTGRLSGALQSLSSAVLPEKYAEKIITVLPPRQIANSVGTGYNGFHRTSCPPTPEYKWLKAIGELRPFSDIGF